MYDGYRSRGFVRAGEPRGEGEGGEGEDRWVVPGCRELTLNAADNYAVHGAVYALDATVGEEYRAGLLVRYIYDNEKEGRGYVERINERRLCYV